MQNPELQILFYGENIATYDVTVSNGVPIIDIKKNRQQNYLLSQSLPRTFLHLTCCLLLKQDKATIRQKYSLKQRRVNSAERQSFDASDMIYTYARSFC
jgi:hypothetical protein